MNTPLKAKVKGGRIVVDAPTDLPEGTELELIPADPFEALTATERTQLNASIDAGLSQARSGQARPLADFVREL